MGGTICHRYSSCSKPNSPTRFVADTFGLKSSQSGGLVDAIFNSRLDRFQSSHDEVVPRVTAQAPTRQDVVTGDPPREARQPGRILLVEDSKVNQMVARQLLERRGHTVVVANNGREALAILDGATGVGFGCVLMDVQMPEMDGLECTTVIRARERGTAFHLPIIALTAHELEAPCLAAGMDAYLSKPIQRDALFELVERYLA
jgi:CheY-like chemotaxis protein